VAIHSLRLQGSRKRRVCSSCGGGIGRGEKFWARNSSVEDREGNRFYGFFQTHQGCEWLCGELGIGKEREERGMSFPGWIPGVLSGMEREELLGIEGWSGLSSVAKERFLGFVGKGMKKGEPKIEYRYWDKDTKERTSFKSTMEGLSGILPSV